MKEFEKIGEFFEDYEGLNKIWSSNDITIIQKRVRKMEKTFFGYSMYEVDGVFFNEEDFNRSGAKREQINKFVAEESVQCIRIILKTNIERILDKFRIKKGTDRNEFMRMRSFIVKCMEDYIGTEHEVEQQLYYTKKS